MIFKIAVNRNDCKGWVLWDDNIPIHRGYRSFAAATGNKHYLALQNPEFNFKVFGVAWND